MSSCNKLFHRVYFSLGIFDQRITSIRIETSSPTSILVSWILLYNQTVNSNETFSVYYSTTGGAEVLAGTTSSLKYNITKLLSNVEYRIRIELNVMFLLKQTFSLQTFHLISIPKDPSPMTTETISTSTNLPISSNFQFTPEISYTVGVVSIVYILLFALFVILTFIVFCLCRNCNKRGDKLKHENNLQSLQAYVNPTNSENFAYIENDELEFSQFFINPLYDLKMNEEESINPNSTYYMEMKAAPKKSLVEAQVSYVASESTYYNTNSS